MVGAKEKGVLRIGNAGGYWGDDPDALRRQVEGGPLDYITMDFLAEITMSILRKQQLKDPSQGFARDFIPMLQPVLAQLLSQGTRVITNAGGVNPRGCAEAIAAMANEQGLSPKIAIVYGDDIQDSLPQLEGQGLDFRNMETGAAFDEVRNRLVAASVYFGAAPVVAALARWEPDIIITGRVTDTGITMAPMIHEFGWSPDDWDKLAAAVVAGHILECGCQSTGGNFTDWQEIASFREMGFPIVEMRADGTFAVTKHPGSGGQVTVATVKEQLFYEMGDPRAYITPDVVADFSSFSLADGGPDRVEVSGCRGVAPTDRYKISMAYSDGYKAVGSILISGPRAREKAQRFAEIFWDRAGEGFVDRATEYVGWNACHRSLALTDFSSEILLRLGARALSEGELQAFRKLIPSLILSGPPGVGVIGGVPRLQSIVSYWPTLAPKSHFSPRIALWDGAGLTGEEEVPGCASGDFAPPPDDRPTRQVAVSPSQPIGDYLAGMDPAAPTLEAICHARSGDKGDMANVGVMARSSEAFTFLRETLTAQAVKDIFQELALGPVIRHEVANLHGLNFLLEESLGGGGSCTLRTDAQGKTFAQGLLQQRLKIPDAVLASCENGGGGHE